MSKSSYVIPIERIERTIYMIRGQKVLLDCDLAELYEVTTKNLNKAVTRNFERFPEDFMFRLNKEEWKILKCQIGTSSSDSLRFQIGTLEKSGRGKYSKYLPYAFTEQGLAMLSGILRSPRAVMVNIEIMRAFVRYCCLDRRLRRLMDYTDNNFKM